MVCVIFPFTSRLFMHVVQTAHGYLGDKVLVTWVVRGDDGEDVPVIFLHDVQHDRSLLLDGRAKLKEHGVVILKMTETHTEAQRGRM